jgi:hypothetical protein
MGICASCTGHASCSSHAGNRPCQKSPTMHPAPNIGTLPNYCRAMRAACPRALIRVLHPVGEALTTVECPHSPQGAPRRVGGIDTSVHPHVLRENHHNVTVQRGNRSVGARNVLPYRDVCGQVCVCVCLIGVFLRMLAIPSLPKLIRPHHRCQAKFYARKLFSAVRRRA